MHCRVFASMKENIYLLSGLIKRYDTPSGPHRHSGVSWVQHQEHFLSASLHTTALPCLCLYKYHISYFIRLLLPSFYSIPFEVWRLHFGFVTKWIIKCLPSSFWLGRKLFIVWNLFRRSRCFASLYVVSWKEIYWRWAFEHWRQHLQMISIERIAFTVFPTFSSTA